MSRKNKIPIEQPTDKQPLSDDALEKLLIKGVLLFFIVIAVYIPAMYGGYIYDDDQLLTKNPIIQRGKNNGTSFIDSESWKGLWEFWYPKETVGAADYFPATSTVLWAEWRLFGNNDPLAGPVTGGLGAPGYHIVNVLMHAFCALLLWMVLERMSIPGAWLTALIWGIHPVGVESVAWISELKNTLSMLIFLIMMLVWLRFLKWERAWEQAVETKPKNWPGLKLIVSRKHWYYGITIGIFIVMLLAKTALVMVPFILLLHIWWQGRLEDRLDWRQLAYFSATMLIYAFWVLFVAFAWWMIGAEPTNLPGWVRWALGCLGVIVVLSFPLAFMVLRWLHKQLIVVLRQQIPFFILSFIFGIITWYFQVTRAIGQEIVPIGDMLHRFSGASFAMGFYVYKILLPINLVLIYPQWHDPKWWGSLPVGVQFIPGIFLAILTYYAWRYRETWGRHFLFAMGFFFVTLFPILGFVKIAYMRLTLVADHFEYTSMVSIIALCVGGVLYYRKFLRYPMNYVLDGAGVCILILFGVLTWQRAWAFHDKELLWKDTLAKNPESWQAHSHYGAILYTRGDFDGALDNWERCVVLKPYIYEVHNNLGLALMAKGHPGAALQQYKAAVEIDNTQLPVIMNYADGLRITKHYEEAVKQYQQILKIAPGHPVAYTNMGVIFFTVNRVDDAIACFRAALQVAPGYPDAQHDLQIALQRKAQEMGVSPESLNNTPQPGPPLSPFARPPQAGFPGGFAQPPAQPRATPPLVAGTSNPPAPQR